MFPLELLVLDDVLGDFPVSGGDCAVERGLLVVIAEVNVRLEHRSLKIQFRSWAESHSPYGCDYQV